MPKVSYLSVLFGLAAIGASAAVYEWYTTKDDKKKRRKGPAAKTKEATSLEFTILNDKVPLVNGRGGHNLNAIQEKTGTTITFREKDDNNHMCKIVGIYENVLEAERLIRESINRSVNVTEDISIPSEAFAKISARGAKWLQEICRKSMAQVYIDSGAAQDPTCRLVKITGTQPNVNLARQLITEKVAESTLEMGNEVKRESRGSSRPEEENVNSAVIGGADQIDGVREAFMEPDALQGQLEVFVSASASIDKFWVQLCGPQSSELDTLVANMTNYYEEEENRKIHCISDPFLGQIITTQFKYDLKWYRAKVVGILPSEFDPRNVVLDVFFVDYGDSQYVDPKDVYSIRMDYLTLRFQAIECFLADVIPARPSPDGDWDSESMTVFDTLTNVARWKKLTAQVVTTKEKSTNNSNAGSTVTGIALFDRSGNSQINIAQQLVNEGLASWTNNRNAQSAVLRLDGGTDSSGSDRKSTVTKVVKNSKKSTKNGHLKNDVNKNVEITSTSARKAAAVSNGADAGNNNGPPSIHDERFSSFPNKSWNEMLEEDE